MNAKELVLAFDAFEERARGCDTWPNRVGLEPVFQHILGSYRSRTEPLDDARKPRFWRNDWRNDSNGSNAGEPLPVVPPPRPADPTDIAEFTILAPKDLVVRSERAGRMLASLGSTASRVAFEIIGTSENIFVQIACAESEKRGVASALRGYFPDVKLREEACHLANGWQLSGNCLACVHLALDDRVFRSLWSEERFDVDPLIEVASRLEELDEKELGLVQVVFEPAQSPWRDEFIAFVRAIEDADGVLPLIEEKFREHLFAVAVRVAALAPNADRCLEIAGNLAAALRTITRSGRNELVAVSGGDHDLDTEALDILDREVRRSGMLLSLSELATLVHMPAASVLSGRFLRQSATTKAAPVITLGHETIIGVNEHDGEARMVSLSADHRSRHVYVIGSSGTGKSTLLLSMAAQDIANGRGFVALDPNGDLVDDIVSRIPESRARDVVLFDPADEDYPVGFNILSAHSELERTLLASDLVSVFKRLSTSFGDVMVSVLGNAVLAFLESSEGGTLIDLRDFLVDQDFRQSMLKTVRDAEVVSYWRREFTLLKGVPHAPVLTRLNTFLRPKLVRRMVAQKKDKLDFRRIIDGGAIFLAKLSHGAIGEENAHLLGSLLVAKFAQAAMSRQNVDVSQREPYTVYIDEFHHFVTPSVATILAGARKYGLGLVLAHQEMRQLRIRSEEVASAVLANAATRVVFRVGEQDAKQLAEGFSSFDAKDLQSLDVGRAIARVDRADFDFNLRTSRLEPVQADIAAARRSAVVASSRERCAVQRDNVDALLESKRARICREEASPERKEREQSTPVTTKRTRRRRELVDVGEMITTPGRGGPQHKYLQSLIGRLAEDRGFEVSVEKSVLDGHGFVDLALDGHGVRVACEISVTTRIEHEVGNLTKCLASGFDFAVLVSSDERTLDLALAEMSGANMERVRAVSPGGVAAFLDELAGPVAKRRATRPRPPSAAKGPENVGPALLTTRDAAAYIGLAMQTLAEMRVTGESPPFHKLGRRVLYDRGDLDAWLARRKRRSTSDSGASGS